MDRASLASMIDHTLLAPEASPDDVRRLCGEAVELGVAAVCVSPSMVAVAVDALTGEAPSVASVVGFPSGAHVPAIKAAEAASAVADGAAEIDVVAGLGLVAADDRVGLVAELAAVRAVAPSPVVLKVIVESALLADDQLAWVCRAAVDAGADMVKTSTGFHPAGGATTHAVRRMRAVVGPDVGVKASGGIRDAATALAMIEAGASRLGASRTREILAGS